MSYTLLSKTTPKARKSFRCIWCGQRIQIGEPYVRETGTYSGDFQSFAFHPKCKIACEAALRECGEEEFEPYDNERPEMKKAEATTAPAI